ncbi:MAG: hypothetical protein H7329_01790 [Opitutaceae bacterium]|nr:hypothetical protein [Cytophagales bacterium]
MFYKIENWSKKEEGAESQIIIDPAHPLFKGHFPQIPILPGACMVQLTHHLTEKYLDRKMTFIRAVQIKFMAMVNPETTPLLKSNFKIKSQEDGTYRVDHQLSFDEITSFKISVFYANHV